MTATEFYSSPDADRNQGRSRAGSERSRQDWASDSADADDTDWSDDRPHNRYGRHAQGGPYARHHRDGQGWFTRAEGWLDERGRGAWIAAMVLGFVFFWPVGLALLAYMIWSKRMFRKSCGSDGHMSRHHYRAAMRPSGNGAFDAYKADTLRRLEEEQSNFEAFLARLREAKDKAEFDNFMEDRARKAASGSPLQEPPPVA